MCYSLSPNRASLLAVAAGVLLLAAFAAQASPPTAVNGVAASAVDLRHGQPGGLQGRALSALVGSLDPARRDDAETAAGDDAADDRSGHRWSANAARTWAERLRFQATYSQAIERQRLKQVTLGLKLPF